MANTFPGGRDALSLKHFGAQTHTSDKAFVGLRESSVTLVVD